MTAEKKLSDHTEQDLSSIRQFPLSEMPPSNEIGATKTSFNIVESLIKLDGGSVSELADALDIPKSTVHSHLKTLENIGYITSEHGHYHVSTRFLDIGARRRQQRDIYKKSKSELEKLGAETEEHASLFIEEDGYTIISETIEGNPSLQVDSHAGLRMVMQNCAPGKAILAFKSDDFVERVINEFGFRAMTENSITSRDALFDELQEIQEQGYAFDREERIEGMRAVAAPILNKNSRPEGALSIFGPANHITGERFTEKIPQILIQSTNMIELNLNYV